MIGERIRELRRKKGLSLTEFARRTGLSKSMISQVETGNTNPSVDTVRSLALALEVPLFVLFLDENESQGTLVRRDERPSLVMPGSNMVRELLTPDLNRAMVLVVGKIPVGETSSPSFTTHRGEECVVVLSGRLSVHLTGEVCELDSGDAFYFSATQPHFFGNPGNTEVEFLSAITPPTVLGRSV
jgi:transcriptional regulator with XRE-family HTH domain